MIPSARHDQPPPYGPLGRARSGIVLAFGAALVSGLAIYLNAFGVKQVQDGALYTTLKNGMAAIVLIALTAGDWRAVTRIGARRWPAVIAVGVVGGSIPFILFFTGLAQASGPNAAFIQKTLFVWVAMLAVPFLGERLGIASIAAVVVLLAGQALVLSPAGMRWGTGESLILAATLMWAVETIIVKRLLASIPARVMAMLRMTVGLVVLTGFLAVTGRLGGLAALNATQWAWVAATGGVLAVYVLTWFAALERAPASVVTSVLVVGAVVTGALTLVGGGNTPSPTVVAGYVLIVAAVVATSVVATRARMTTPQIAERVVA